LVHEESISSKKALTMANAKGLGGDKNNDFLALKRCMVDPATPCGIVGGPAPGLHLAALSLWG